MTKITENDLDPILKEKINQFDLLKTENNNETYLTYENGEFTKKPVNKLNISRVFSSDEVFKLKQHLYHSKENYISAYDNILCESADSYASSALLTKLSGSFAFRATAKIIKIKTYSTFFLVLDRNGNMSKISRSNPSISKTKNVVNIIHMNYVYKNFDVFSITDFEYYNNGVLLATEEHGVFYISFDTEENASIIKELGISHIKLLSDKETLLITKSSDKNNVILYNLKLNVKLNTFNQLGRYHQEVLSIDIENNQFFVLGKSFGINQSDNLLHYWKLDAAGAEYENRDREIAENPCDNLYRPKLVKSDESFVYIIGTKEKKMFIWEYDKDNLSTTPSEYEFDLQDFEYDDIKDFININGRFFITLKNKILVLDDHFNLLENYLLTGADSFDSVKITPNGVYAVNTNDCYTFYIPKKIYVKATDIGIIHEAESFCNNIDILVKAPNDARIIFIDKDENQKIDPYFYMKLDSIYHVIKLNNIVSKNLIMRIGTTEDEKIAGIVVHKNRIFYK